MNAALKFTAGLSWCELAKKLSPEDQKYLSQLLAQMLEQMEAGKYPPKSSDEVDRKLVAQTLSRATDISIEKLQFCSFSDVRRNGLKIGTVSLSFNDSSPGLGVALAQSFRGKRLIDAIGDKYRKLRVDSINNEWSAQVTSFVDTVQEMIRATTELTALRMFDLAQTFGYLLNYFLHFELAGKSDNASCLKAILELVAKECLPLAHTNDRWIVLVA